MEQQQSDPPRSIHESWIKHQRNIAKTTQSFACAYCPDRRISTTADELWNHAIQEHRFSLPVDGKGLDSFRQKYELESALKRTRKEDSYRRPVYNEVATAGPAPPPPLARKRTLSNPIKVAPSRSRSRSLSHQKTLNLQGTLSDTHDVPMRDGMDDSTDGMEQPRKRAAIGDGILDGSASPIPFRDSPSPPPRRSKARPTSAPNSSSSETAMQRRLVFKKTLWSPDQESISTWHDAYNIASIQARKSRLQAFQAKTRMPSERASHRLYSHESSQGPNPANIVDRSIIQADLTSQKEESYDIVMQPETRTISQEQLVAEVKGIYAGLVMVEAKCIEVDNEQAGLTSEDAEAQPKLNNEQWRALIALHRTLLHEHHDFFLASEHPSASPALRRLASKYAMPARRWRHGIHCFLALLRHKLPVSSDHMLAFIFLAYSTMALLNETIPAIEDTWIKCLGDPRQYRLGLEDGDIRDREVWTGIARHWYSKASDKAPTMGRLYHYMAGFARPDYLQQLCYCSKSLSVKTLCTSAKESILTLLDQGQHQLLLLDTAITLKTQELLVTCRRINRFNALMVKYICPGFTYSGFASWLPRHSPSSYTSPLKYLLEHGTTHGFERHRQCSDSISRGKLHFPYNKTAVLFHHSFLTDSNDPELWPCFQPPETRALKTCIHDCSGSHGFRYFDENESPTFHPMHHTQSNSGSSDSSARLKIPNNPSTSHYITQRASSDGTTLQNALNVLEIIGSMASHISRLLSWKTLLFLVPIQVVEARSFDRTSRPNSQEESEVTVWKESAVSNVIPLLQALTWCAALFVVSRAILRNRASVSQQRQRQSRDGLEDPSDDPPHGEPEESTTLAIFMIASICGTIYIGSDENLPKLVLVPVCTFSGWLISQYYHNRFARLHQGAGPATATIIGGTVEICEREQAQQHSQRTIARQPRALRSVGTPHQTTKYGLLIDNGKAVGLERKRLKE
ncbi:esl2 [Hyphodiscus hymeniophilus]|uniref:Esl2 n=1 Tax=Hyphodiscus hymeniophilus TaxID=353542 RepID=A0A9P7AWH7_9HELO|nr:esl2 [Hyphodiscus hymeniophilus]